MITFRPYQRQCIDAFYEYYNTGKGGHGLIVVPTAGGKSLIIGGLASEICQKWRDQRILILSHVRELIQQNHAKVLACWPSAPVGIYSAAIGKRQAHFPIVVATIQSVYKKAMVLGHRDLVFIDEAHLLNTEGTGMYNDLLKELIAINPALRVCGFTATDYRLDTGLLTEGKNKMFDDVIIDISIKQLLDDGYLTPPISKASLVQANLEGVKLTGGEYNIKQMAARFDQEAFINAALDNDMPFLADRHSIALFSATLENAAHIAHAMGARGIECEVIDGKMNAEQRDGILERFRSGALRALASVGVITTGTDIPNIDAIVLFRATQSPGLYQQIIGRGFRVLYADGDITTREGRLAAIRNGKKPNFLTLDHGGNIERHGAITHVEKPMKREKGERRVEKAKCRICEVCRSPWPLDVIICGLCQHQMVAERDPTANLDIESSHADIMGSPFSRGEVAEWFDVDDVKYARHKKEGSADSLCATYFCGMETFKEWIHFERIGWLKKEAIKWWNLRSPVDLNIHSDHPFPITAVLQEVDKLKKPLRILVKKEDKFYRINAHAFQPAPQGQLDKTA